MYACDLRSVPLLSSHASSHSDTCQIFQLQQQQQQQQHLQVPIWFKVTSPKGVSPALLALVGSCDGCTRRCRRRHRQCPPQEGRFRSFFVVSGWRRPCRVPAPQRTAPEDGKGRGVGVRDALHGPVPDLSSTPRQQGPCLLRGVRPPPLVEENSMTKHCRRTKRRTGGTMSPCSLRCNR